MHACRLKYILRDLSFIHPFKTIIANQMCACHDNVFVTLVQLLHMKVVGSSEKTQI